MAFFTFPPSPEELLTFDENSVKRMFRAIGAKLNSVLTGKLNALGEVTLTANAATTVLTDARLTTGSYIDFDPVTANAATEKAAGTIYVLAANRRKGVATITHANAASADRVFRVLLIG